MAISRNHSPSVIGLGSKFILPLLAIVFILSHGICSLSYGAVVPKSTPSESSGEKSIIQQKLLNLQIPFIVNQGQIKDKNVRFHAQTMGGAVYITKNGQMAYFFPKTKTSNGLIVREDLINSTKINPQGSDPSNAKVNYIIGNDSKEWKTGLKTFNTLSYGEVYKGIDLNLKAHGNTVEKIFTVRPGADPQEILLSLYVAEGLFINESGELEARFGKEKISFSRPIAFQDIEGKAINVAVAYQLKDGGYGFKVGKYDTTHPLIIDPSLVYVSYLGGDNDDAAYDIAIDDADGYIYIAGSTNSSNFLYGENSDTTASGNTDAFVVRLSKEGPEVDMFTYLGGNNDDFCYGMALGEKESEEEIKKYVYLTGQTQSKKFPTKRNGYDTKIGGNTDAWFAVLNASDLTMVTGSYLGGGGADTGYSVAVDSEGNAYVVGETLSSSFPIPDPGVPFANSKGGVDAFVAKFSFTDDGWCDLLYSTYIGGNGDDRGWDIAVENESPGQESIYVTGQTASPDLYTSISNFPRDLNGSTDAFLAIFQYNSADNRLAINFLSYLGGSGADSGEAIVVDGDDIYVAGWTESASSFLPPCSENCDFDGETDGFVIRVNGVGPSPVFCTAILGIGLDDRIYDLAVDADKNIVVTGETDFEYLTGTTDVFVAELQMGNNETCFPVVSSSAISGNDNDVGNGVSFDAVGNIYLTGTSYGLGDDENNSQDAFLAMLCEDGDADGVCNLEDLCLEVPNGPKQGTCSVPVRSVDENEVESYSMIACEVDSDCLAGSEYFGYCSKSNEDNDEDGWGDACDDNDDSDALDDWFEAKYHYHPISGIVMLDPLNSDTNNDGTLDSYEDFDPEGLPNIDEQEDGTDPYWADTDKDNWSDLHERQIETDPRDPTDAPGSDYFKTYGIYVDINEGNDYYIGTKIDDTVYAVKTLHMAVQRLHMLDPEEQYTIYITPGTYNAATGELRTPLVIHQDVILQALPPDSNDDDDTVVLDGAVSDANPLGTEWNTALHFSQGAANIELNGLTIENFEKSIVLNSDGGCLDLYNVLIESPDNGTAITLVDTDQQTIDFNQTSTISGGQVGIAFDAESFNNTIIGASIKDSQVGVSVVGGSGNTLVAPFIGTSDIGVIGAHGLLLNAGTEAFTVEGGTIENMDVGVGFATSALCLTLTDATIQNCRVGIEFLENYMIHLNLGISPNATRIQDNGTGITFKAGSSDNWIYGGLVDSNERGLVFDVCGESPDDNHAIGTYFVDNTEIGVGILAGSGNQIIGVEDPQSPADYLDITGSDVGIYIAENSNQNTVRGYSLIANSTANIRLEGNNNVFEQIDILAGDNQQGVGEFYGSSNSFTDVNITGQNSEGVYGLLIEPGNSKVTFSDVTITGFDIGVGFATDAACVTFEGSNSITCTGECEAGVLLAENYMLDIDLGTNTMISGFENGIKIIGGSSNNTLRNAIVTDSSLDGILVDGCNAFPDDNKIISAEIFENAGNGVAFMAGSGNEIIDSLIYRNNIDDVGAVSNAHGGVAILSSGASVKYSKINNNGCTGIYADEASPVVLSDNVIYGHAEGVRLSFTSDVTVSNNTIAGNTDNGLVIEPGSEPTLLYNIFYDNKDSIPDEEPDEEPEHDLLVEDEFYNIPFGSLEYNIIGTTNLPWLPPSNLPLDPLLETNYSLKSSSPAIDGTPLTMAGRDYLGESRPVGQYWDIGAFEAPEFADSDKDGIPDWWELYYFGNLTTASGEPTSDQDGDLIPDIDEYLSGSDPKNPVGVSITLINNESPADPYLTDKACVEIEGMAYNAGSAPEAVQLKVNGVLITIIRSGDSWETNSCVALNSGENRILATANDGTHAAVTDQLTAVLDDQPPVIVITDPLPAVEVINDEPWYTYTTALESIAISGTASDVAGISAMISDTGGMVYLEGGTWQTESIDLTNVSEKQVTITAYDSFSNSTGITITIIKDTSIDSTSGDVAVGLPQENPLDPDGDGYVSEDEISCGSDPNDETSVPENVRGNTYEEGSLLGYNKPDCLNPDDDGDRLPDWWELEYGLDPYDKDTDDNGIEDDQEDFDIPENDGQPEGDGFTNFEEYQNGTNPHHPQTIKFELTVHALQDSQLVTDISATWLPEYLETLVVKAVWKGDVSEAPPDHVIFSLKETSSYPGRAVNDPDPANMPVSNYPAWYQYEGFDFGLAGSMDDHSYAQKTAPIVQQTDGDTVFYTIHLQSWDYGGRTKLFVESQDDPSHIAFKWVPEGSGNNGIGQGPGNDPENPWLYDADDTLVANADIDEIVFSGPSYSAPLGDDFTNFEEYRGIIYTTIPGLNLPEDTKPAHQRLDPNRKDLFVRGIGFTAGHDCGSLYDPLPIVPDGVDYYPFRIGLALENTGIDVHNTTCWGHDASEDFTFFTYIHSGQGVGISSVTVTADSDAGWLTTWPKHEWEFKLDADDEEAWTPIGRWVGSDSLALDMFYPGDGTAGAYSIRRPLPHINVLLVWHDSQSDSLFPWDDGHVKFVSASPPSNQNLMGTRNWTWSVKGYSRTVATQEQDSMYGIAFTLQNPLDRYFGDLPYEKETFWDGNAWVDADGDDSKKLFPLSMSEDYTDSGTPTDGFTLPNIGVLPDNVPNGVWDGDRRVLDASLWPTYGTSSPFNIDGDDAVELPFASHPDTIDSASEQMEIDGVSYRYTKGHVLKHTITHEIVHALAGPPHTDDPADLMNRYSNNWSRLNHLSDYYRSLLRIHNKKRW